MHSSSSSPADSSRPGAKPEHTSSAQHSPPPGPLGDLGFVHAGWPIRSMGIGRARPSWSQRASRIRCCPACPSCTPKVGRDDHAVENVAPPCCAMRHAQSSRSLRSTMACDIHGHPCRSGRQWSATCTVVNVAPDDHGKRHAASNMSLTRSGWSDIVVDACRTARACGATHSRGHVARLTDQERHALAGMSLSTRVKCDIDPCAASPYRSSKATSTVLHVAPLG